MKIAYVHTGLFPSNSPSFTFATLNAIGLAQQAERCYFFIQKNSTYSSHSILKKYFNITQPDNLIIVQFPGRYVINTHFFYFQIVFNQLKKLLLKNELDAIISRNTTFLPYLAKLHKKFSIPTYYETHDFYADLSIRDDINRRRKSKYSRLEQKYIPQISGVICLQETQKVLYQKYFPEQNIFVARTGIHQITPLNNPGSEALCYIGSLDAHKGVITLLQAAAKSKTQPPIIIIGGKNKNEIKKYNAIVNEYYHINMVTITGWLPRSELENHLRKVKIGIIPLNDTFFNRYLTSPLKLFDFFSFGIPVISADLPTMRELIIEKITGLFFESQNHDDLAQKIDSLYENEVLFNNLKNNLPQAVDKFLWHNRAKQILNHIQ